MAEAPRWEQDGADWPNRAQSRFVAAGGLRWHVQVMGNGPALLLLHGTGAATHSWRDLLPALARDFTVVAPDLPGHGFTAAPAMAGLSLPGMARAIAALLGVLGVAPALAAGHSAGAAILARMCLEGKISPAGLVSLNGAFLPLGGAPARIFSPLARMLSRVTLVPEIFAWQAADGRVVARLMRGTGSTIDAAGMVYYGRLMRRSGHAAAALGMMAHWDLQPLQRDLPRLTPRLLLIVGSNDRSISPAEARRVARLVPGAKIATMAGLGHLAHEENPAEAARLIAAFAIETGILSRPSPPG
jgi:magnesium chelatase accessory protein